VAQVFGLRHAAFAGVWNPPTNQATAPNREDSDNRAAVRDFPERQGKRKGLNLEKQHRDIGIAS
jgi:hypothetical protein